MQKISVIDEQFKNINIYKVQYNKDEIIEYINNICEISPTKEDEKVHVKKYESTNLNSTNDLKKYLVSLLDRQVLNLEEINKLEKSNSPIRSGQTFKILKEFLDKFNYELEISLAADEISKIARQFMMATFDKISNEELEAYNMSTAISNKEALSRVGFSINPESKTR